MIKRIIMELLNPALKYERLCRYERKSSAAIFSEQYNFLIKREHIYRYCKKCGFTLISYYRKNNSIAFTKCELCGKEN